MSLLGRFLGGTRSKAYAEGVTHLEEGRYAEAVDCLRVAALGKSDTPSGSLASFHFRQALLREGRRLLRTEDKARAIPFFGEAVKLWDQYPDLHCLLGAACGLSGDWETGLVEGRHALRLNPDYAEARLLEAVALQELDREREAVQSLNNLVESGRRVEHWLIAGLADSGPFTSDNIPADLKALLIRSLSGQSEKEEVASAVALCRSGNWDEGLERFAELVARRPRYPDYRTRHAAALFQTGDNAAALAEVEAALALNDRYRTAVDLKGLILADGGQIRSAAAYLVEADKLLDGAKPGNTHENMFGAYLRAVLSLLTGQVAHVRDVLGEWPDLTRNFARAELLLAAADDLLGDRAACERRLTALVAEWKAEPLYFHLLACHHLEGRRYQEVTGVLGRWPSAVEDQPDLRPLYLEGLLAVAQGRVPKIPDDTEAGAPRIDPVAWTLLSARSAFLQGANAECWQSCQELVAAGLLTEPIVKLQTEAAAADPGAVPSGWQPLAVLPTSCLPAAVHFAVNNDDGATAAGLVRALRRVHPECLAGFWLDADFWLAPVRGWIA